MENKIDLSKHGLSEEELFTIVTHDETESEKITAPRYSYWRSVFRVFFRKKINWIVLGILLVLLLFTYIYPRFVPFDRFANVTDSTSKHLQPKAAIEKYGFSLSYILGTGASGEPTFDAVWYGSKISLSLAIVCAAINMVIGVLVGAVWGYSKKIDLIMVEVRNIIANIPYELLIAVMVLVLTRGFWTMVFALTVTGWLGVAAFIRTQVIIIRDREYNLASRCLGTPIGRIATKNILPFMTSVIVTYAALEIPAYIGFEVFLSYIGLGLSDLTLGKMISEAQGSMVVPGWGFEFWSPVAISAILSIVLFVVGQNLGDASDPRTHM
ncbi:MAG: ABC transporter permease [Lachnospiraceae bacterium]|nr:ABC transporter permease [Lachnospiraceae bacterium]